MTRRDSVGNFLESSNPCLRFIYFMHLTVLPECLYVHCMHAWSPRRLEEGAVSPRAEH